MLDPVMFEIDQLQEQIDTQRRMMRTLLEMLRQLGVEVYFSPDGVTVTNTALEAPHPIALGEGYTGLGAAGD